MVKKLVVVKPDRSRKRPVGSPTHVRSWPLRPTPGQPKTLETRFYAGTRLYNAVLGEFLNRSRAVKNDPRYVVACATPKGAARTSLFAEIDRTHGWSRSAAQSFGSSLRATWVREQVPAQEAQALAARAYDAVADWHYNKAGKGKPRFKPARRGVRSMASKDAIGALRPETDVDGFLVGLRWGRGFVIPIAAPATGFSRRAREEQAEYARINELIGTGNVLSTRIVKTVIRGRNTYRMQIAMDGHPDQRHLIGDGRVGFDLGPSNVSIAAETPEGWATVTVPLAPSVADQSKAMRRLQRRLDRQHRAGSPECFRPDGTHKRACVWGRRDDTGTVGSPHSKAALRTKTQIADLHRRIAATRKTEHGRLANLMFEVGPNVVCEKLNYVSWQKTFPRSVRDRAPGMFVETVRRKAASAGGDTLYELNPYTTALSQTCLCGSRTKKSLNERTHLCGTCGITDHRDEFSAYLSLHVVPGEELGTDVLNLETANRDWNTRVPAVADGLLRYETDAASRPNTTTTKRRGRRPCKRATARTKARQSRSTRTSQEVLPTATPDLMVAA